MSNFKLGLLILVSLLGIGALGFVGSFYGLEMRRFFAPKQEEVRRQVFMESHTYQRGVIERLAKTRLEYKKAEAKGNDIHMQMFREKALNDIATIDLTSVELPMDLQLWIKEIKY